MRVNVVENCPRCDSGRTGTYHLDRKDRELFYRLRFSRGERVRFYDLRTPKATCFCEDCGYNWNGMITPTKMTDQEFNNYLHEHKFYEDREKILARDGVKVKTIEEKSKSWKRWTNALSLTTGIDIRKFNPYSK